MPAWCVRRSPHSFARLLATVGGVAVGVDLDAGPPARVYPQTARGNRVVARRLEHEYGNGRSQPPVAAERDRGSRTSYRYAGNGILDSQAGTAGILDDPARRPVRRVGGHDVDVGRALDRFAARVDHAGVEIGGCRL